MREIFPHEDPIGHRIQCGLDSMNYMTIVGVVGDIRDEPGTPPAHELYMPIAQHPGRGSLQEIVVRTSVAPATLIETVRQRIQRADPDVATKLTTYESHAADAVATPRFRTWLVSSFAGLALLLAVAGVYGLLTYLTAQRTPELGVRMALGAGPAEVIGLVLGRAAIIAAGGLLIGVVLSLARQPRADDDGVWHRGGGPDDLRRRPRSGAGCHARRGGGARLARVENRSAVGVETELNGRGAELQFGLGDGATEVAPYDDAARPLPPYNRAA